MANKFWDTAAGVAGGGIFSKNARNAAGNFLTGQNEIRENVSTLRPEQEPIYQQLTNAAQNRGAGGAYGTAADYYRDLLSNDNADYQAFAAPALRQYSQDIVPGLSEQFAGMGAGGLSSSGFRNAQIQGATDLSERLGALRANLRQAGAQGLQNIGQLGLQPYSQNMATQQGTPGLLAQLGPAIAAGAGAYFAGPPGAAAGYQAGNWLLNGGNKAGATTGPYGPNGPQASAQIPPQNYRGGY